MKNRSPWIHELNTERSRVTVTEDVLADVCIVGAGIAGIATSFFLLRDTHRKVTLVEGYRLAHGATGHNAGQLVAEFEESLVNLAAQHGEEKVAYAQKALERGWDLFDDMYTQAGVSILFSRFLGAIGYTGYDQVINHLRENAFRKKHHIPLERLLIAENAPFAKTLEADTAYNGLYEFATQDEVLVHLETNNRDYIAAGLNQKGCINSALFCQEIVAYLQKTYPHRFTLYEEAPVQKIVLKKEYGILDIGNHTIQAGRIILCTNGFEHFTILNQTGLDVDTAFHHDVKGGVSYMSGYTEKQTAPAAAIAYLFDPTMNYSDPYYYLTRRPYEFENSKSLVCIGGPELSLEDRTFYIRDKEYPTEIVEKIDDFLKTTYAKHPKDKKVEYQFTWHGLMGYTSSKVRLIGPEPRNPILMYNLGCNGIGILPSVYGGYRIARQVRGERMVPSLFDPK